MIREDWWTTASHSLPKLSTSRVYMLFVKWQSSLFVQFEIAYGYLRSDRGILHLDRPNSLHTPRLQIIDHFMYVGVQ